MDVTEMPPELNCYVTDDPLVAGEAERALSTSRASRTDVANSSLL